MVQCLSRVAVARKRRSLASVGDAVHSSWIRSGLAAQLGDQLHEAGHHLVGGQAHFVVRRFGVGSDVHQVTDVDRVSDACVDLRSSHRVEQQRRQYMRANV